MLSAVQNETRFISEMIASVRAQTHEDWELLFVDDGSLDSTPFLINEAAGADQRIKVVAHGRRVGKVRAFNQAFEASTGDVVALLAGDDTLPVDSLAKRAAAFAEVLPADRVVAYFKLRMFSDDPRYDDIVLPRGTSGSRSGGSVTMSRGLAAAVFPIDEALIAEDIWLSHASADLASAVIERPEVIMNYRIHSRNSHQRGQRFSEMTKATNDRLQSYRARLDAKRLDLSTPSRQYLEQLWQAEQARFGGKTLEVLFRSRLPLVDRVAIASESNPALYTIRTRFYKLFSGRRGR